MIGGTLLLAPGFLTDIVGALPAIPPTRALARRVLRRLTVGRFTVMGVPGRGGGQRPPAAPAARYDYDATAEEVPDNGDGAGRQLPRLEDDETAQGASDYRWRSC